MKIIHRVSINGLEAEPFRKLGLDLNEIKSKIIHFVSFDISEDDPRWAQVAQLVKKTGAGDFAWTKFTEAELMRSKFLVMIPAWHHGYPQPEDDFAYLSATYDLTEYCKSCGAGAKQAAPFRMKGAPLWGKRSILQLNWVFDEYFVKPEVWKRVFEPFGIKYRTVVQKPRGYGYRVCRPTGHSDTGRVADGRACTRSMLYLSQDTF